MVVELLSKVVSKEEALSKIHDGQTIMFGDWHGEFAADEIIDGMLEKGVKDIHAIAVSAGMPDQGVGKLIREKRVKTLVTTHIALNPLARDQMFAGELDIEFCPQGTWSERIRCGGFFRNYPLLLLYPMYLNFASSNCLPHLPYIVRFIIFNLLLVPSTNPLL